MVKQDRVKYLFVGPGIAWIILFTIFPLLYSLRLSFLSARLGKPENFIGLDNYLNIAGDYRFKDALIVTIIFVVVSVSLTLLLGLGLALLFNRPMPGQRFFRALFTLPLFTAPIALGYLGLTIFHEDVGPINLALEWLGMTHPPGWLHDIWAARLAIVLVDAWQWTPFCFLVILAGLQSLPEEIYEAARLDTSSALDLFRHVTLPLLAPVLITVTLLRLVETFKVMDIPFALTSGGPGTATITYSFYIFQTGLRQFNMGYASSLAYILLIIMFVISSIFFSRLRAIYE